MEKREKSPRRGRKYGKVRGQMKEKRQGGQRVRPGLQQKIGDAVKRPPLGILKKTREGGGGKTAAVPRPRRNGECLGGEIGGSQPAKRSVVGGGAIG